MPKLISLKPDPITKKPRFKVDLSNVKFEINGDVVLGNPYSNLAIGIIYTWLYDDTKAFEFFNKIVQKVTGYSAITGMLRTVYGLNLAISNIVKNPNINKWLIIVPNKSDNVHFVVDALIKLYNDDLKNSLSANKNINLDKNILERFRKQLDLIVLKRFNDKDMDKLVKLCDATVSDKPKYLNQFPLEIEFYSYKFNTPVVYDDGARFTDILEVKPIKLCPEIFYTRGLDLFEELKKRAIKIDNKYVVWNIVIHFEAKELKPAKNTKIKPTHRFIDQNQIFLVFDELKIENSDDVISLASSESNHFEYITVIILKAEIFSI